MLGGFFNKPINNWWNKRQPKFTMIYIKDGEPIEEGFNSVMALKMKAKLLADEKIKYDFRENW